MLTQIKTCKFAHLICEDWLKKMSGARKNSQIPLLLLTVFTFLWKTITNKNNKHC